MVSSVIATGAMALAFTAVSAVPASASLTPAVSDHATSPDTVQAYWYTVRSNWFYTLESCNSYGFGATGNGSGDGYVPGTTAHYCYKEVGHAKWSIDLFYSDGR